MELFEEIRRGYAAGETIKGLAKKHGVHRRMVRQARAPLGAEVVHGHRVQVSHGGSRGQRPCVARRVANRPSERG